MFTARFADYRDVSTEGEGAAARPFAHDVDLDFPRVDANAHFRFKQVSLPADIPDALFELKLPERGARRAQAATGSAL